MKCSRTIPVVFSGFLILGAIASENMATSAQGQANTELRGGLWFDGAQFRQDSAYAIEGRLTHQRPIRVDRVIDLQGLFVVPPFGDAHTHHFDSPQTTPQLVARYLAEGTFYAKVMTEPRSRAELSASMVNSPESVDVIYAHGGLTSSYSHPIEVYEAVALGYTSYEQHRTRGGEVRASRIREGDAYYIIDNERDLEKKWGQILAGKPDFIKVYLRSSECYRELGWPRNPGTWNFAAGGLAPELIPSTVKRAHDAGLRVAAAVNTAFDVHVALASGVDEISHLPGYQGVRKTCASVSYSIPVWDAKLAADRKVDFVLIVKEYLVPHPPEVFEGLRENVRTLSTWGVPLTIGSDSYGSLPLKGVLGMAEQGVLSPAELLRIWSMSTPQAIFPNRRVGCLADGCEASLIALRCNPTQTFTCVTDIQFRMKQGHVLELAPAR